MARRRQTIGGDEGGDDIVDAYTQAYFKRGQQEDPRLATAIQLLGLQSREQQAGLEREQQARQQEALERYQSGQLGIEREKLGVSAKEAEAAEKGRQEERAFREGATTRDIQYKMDQATKEAEKTKGEQENKLREIKAGVLKQTIAAGRPLTPMEEAMLGNIDPEYKDVAAGMREQALGEAVAQNLERFRGMKPEQRKAILQNPVEMGKIGGIEGYNRIMQQLGEQPGVAGAPASKGPNMSVANLLWNTPGGIENIFRGIANVGGRAIYGRDVPQYSYVPWTEVNVAGGGGPPTPVGPPPETPLQPGLGGYGPMVPQEAVPEWQYGVGTRRPAPPALPVDDILARARLGQ